MLPQNADKPKLNLFGASYSGTRATYDSIQQQLPAAKKDSRMKRQMTYRQMFINKEFKGDNAAYIAHFTDRFLHGFPTIFFISLPLVALVLKLICIRHKQIPIANHGIYLVHILFSLFCG